MNPRGARKQVADLYLHGLTYAQIARPECRAWPGSDDERLAAGYADGLTFHELAEQLKRPVRVIYTRIEHLRRAGRDLPPRKPRWTPAAREQLAHRYREGATYRQLCLEFERIRSTISRQLRRLRDEGVDLTRHPLSRPHGPRSLPLRRGGGPPGVSVRWAGRAVPPVASLELEGPSSWRRSGDSRAGAAGRGET